MARAKKQEPLMIYLTKIQRKLDEPRCENVGCTLRSVIEVGAANFIGIPLEPPIIQNTINWQHEGQSYERKIFLCCECQQLANSKKQVQVAILS